jgi:histidyl-tRNA synthetase
VRGLDYYTGTVFEIRADNDLGSLGGGGRYDKMVEEFGGPPTPAVGFAFGVERVALSIPGDAESFDPPTDVFLASHGEAAQLECLKIAHALRRTGVRAELDHRGASMKAQLKRADKLRARAVLVIGEDELAKGEVMLRDMAAGEQRSIKQADLAAELAGLLRKPA